MLFRSNPEQDLFYKPAETPATLVAKRSRLGQAYLDWSSWPLVTEIGPTAPIDAAPGTADWTAVSFRDLRFMYDTSLIQGRNNPPLSGTVYVDADHQVTRMDMGRRVQK